MIKHGEINFQRYPKICHGHFLNNYQSTSMLVTDGNNVIQLINPDISGAIFTLGLSIKILNSQCVEGAIYVRVL